MLAERLQILSERLGEMAELVRSMLYNALAALETRNIGLAERIVVDELAVNRMETANLEEAVHVIALFQPMGKNIRQLVAVILVNRDLERIADHAQNIECHARFLAGQPPTPAPPELAVMEELARKMLADSLRAYEEQDEELAKLVIAGDEELNELTKKTVRGLLVQMAQAGSRPGAEELMECYWRLALVARNLERVGDHATNIAESVLFVVESHLHLHHKQEIAKELAAMKRRRSPKKKR
ncbi:MAG TPA: phosphate signaling complex protein PhoU [Candidatus Coatesbacteria bacterium]|nr:phosphate signaling complex protein PhoU [Candidatus Coatesbacteria bacterium]